MENRGEVISALKEKGIPSAVHYPAPLHLQTAVEKPSTHAPEAVAASKQVLSLPFHPYISKEELNAIADVIKETQDAIAQFD